MPNTDVSQKWDSELDADLFLLDHKSDKCLGFLPEDFVSTVFLTEAGDFCLSRNAAYALRLSVKAEDNSVHHMIIDHLETNEYCVRGIVFGRAPSVGELIYNLREPTFDVVSAILDAKIRFRRLVTKEVLQDRRILNEDKFHSVRLLNQDPKFRYYSAQFDNDGKTNDVVLKKPRNFTTDFEWKQMMFEELRVAIVMDNLKLPVRSPMGAVLTGPGYLVYSVMPGVNFSDYLLDIVPSMDVGAKILVCRGISSVMAELHMANLFHGALTEDNFFVKFRKNNPTNIRIMFNGGLGLIPKGTPKRVTSADFTKLAPEVAWTRLLSSASGVYSIGRLFKAIMGSGTNKGDDPNLCRLHAIESLISCCMNRKPDDRPTMDGAFMTIESICKLLVPNPSAEKWKINRHCV